jgi:hypothetical protein
MDPALMSKRERREGGREGKKEGVTLVTLRYSGPH